MPDRLSELLQQRRLIQDHLAWLDREIAAATKTETALGAVSALSLHKPLPAPTAPLPGSACVVFPPEAPAASSQPSPTGVDPEALLAEYQQDPQNLQVDVKRGCFLYFGIAMGLLLLVVALIYMNYLRHRSDPSARSPAPTVEKR